MRAKETRIVAVAFLLICGTLLCCPTPSPDQAHARKRKNRSTVVGKKVGLPGARHGSSGQTARLGLGVSDRGVFQQHAHKVRIKIPPQVGSAHTSIHVNKARRILVLSHHGVPVKVYPISLGNSPKGHKRRQGDGRTPEGKYYISEARSKNLPLKYGARSLLLSYPNLSDANKCHGSSLMTKAQLDSVRAAIAARRTPLQNTACGSSIRIHGGGVQGDWTAGCIAMRDKDVIELYDHVRKGTDVIVAADKTPFDQDSDGIPDQVDILIGAKKLVMNGARYKGGYYRIRYPGGDVPDHIGVCTDVIIRAFRNAGHDLQVDLYRHISRNRRLYPQIRVLDRNIDHRRVRNLLTYFKARFRLVGEAVSKATRHRLLPGDVVFLDTLSRPGPDHIGIISDTVASNGFPLVINNWTYGYKTSEMALLPSTIVTHHFRIH